MIDNQTLATKPLGQIEGKPYRRENCPFCQGFGRVWIKQAGSPREVQCGRCAGSGKSQLVTK